MSDSTSGKPWPDRDHELSEGIEDSQAYRSASARAPGSFPGHQAPEPVSPIENDPAKLRDQLARVQAEFQNARKRTIKEQQDFREYALFDAAKTLLPIVDNFERALRISPRENPSFRTGLELIHKQLLDALSKFGVRPIQVNGQKFDPTIHEAVEMVDTDVFEDQHVVDELRRGYLFKDRLLRPAMVRVAKNQSGHNHHIS